jgi:hypothetical protein
VRCAAWGNYGGEFEAEREAESRAYVAKLQCKLVLLQERQRRAAVDLADGGGDDVRVLAADLQPTWDVRPVESLVSPDSCEGLATTDMLHGPPAAGRCGRWCCCFPTRNRYHATGV